MPAPAISRSVVAFDRPAPRSVARDISPLPTGPTRPTRPARTPRAGTPDGFDPVLRAPGLALLATVCLLEGYRWIGALPAGDSRLSSVVFSRGGALVFAVSSIGLALGLTRTGRGRQARPQIVVALATLVVMSATVALAVTEIPATKAALGVADLGLASALAGALVAGERRRRARPAGPVPVDPGAVDPVLVTVRFPTPRSRTETGVAS